MPDSLRHRRPRGLALFAILASTAMVSAQSPGELTLGGLELGVASPRFSIAGEAPRIEDQDTEPVGAAEPSRQPDRDDEWRFMWLPHVWLPSVSGDVTVSGNRSEIGSSISDVLDVTKIALFQVFTARKGRFGIYHYGSFSAIEDEARVLGTKIESEAAWGIFDLGVVFRAVERELFPEDEKHQLRLDIYAGLRYQYLNTKLKIRGLGNSNDTHDWLEPLVGGMLTIQITERVLWNAIQLDLSGFGVGTASDLTTMVATGVGYRAWEQTSLRVGYRLISLDYARGSGSDRFAQDLTYHGLYLGISFEF